MKALWKQIQDSRSPASPGKPKAIRRRTPKRAIEEAQYRKRVKEIFSTPQVCRNFFCTAPATEVHHRSGRAGKLLNYEPEWILLCADCHRFIHDHPKQARTMGFLCELGQWNNQGIVPKKC